MGTKFKFWYEDPLLGRTLFKEGRPGTGENWAEKLACEFASMMRIPHAYYELAEWRGQKGVLSPLFFPRQGQLIHGNELLKGKISASAGEDKVRHYAERSHDAVSVLGMLKYSGGGIHPPIHYTPVGGLTSPLDIFIGYLLFDAWIGNQDRHSQNWGLVRVRDLYYLAPSYDHGSSLAGRLHDAERERRLTTKDRGSSVEKFASTARSALYPPSPTGAKLRAFLTDDAFAYAARFRREAARTWLECLESIPLATVRSAIDMIPDDLMSPIAKDFTDRLLKANRDRLLALKF